MNILNKLDVDHSDFYIHNTSITPQEIINIYTPYKMCLLSAKIYSISKPEPESEEDLPPLEHDDDLSQAEPNLESEDSDTEFEPPALVNVPDSELNRLLTSKGITEHDNQLSETSDDSDDVKTMFAQENVNAISLTRNIKLGSSYYYYDVTDSNKFLQKHEPILNTLNKDYNECIQKKEKFVYLLFTNYNNNNGYRILPFVSTCKNIVFDNIDNKINTLLSEYLKILYNAKAANSLTVFKNITDYDIKKYFTSLCNIISTCNNEMLISKFYICNKSNGIMVVREINNDLCGLCITKFAIFFIKLTCRFDVDDGFIIDYNMLSANVDSQTLEYNDAFLFADDYVNLLNEYKETNPKYCVDKIRNYMGNCFVYDVFNKK